MAPYDFSGHSFRSKLLLREVSYDGEEESASSLVGESQMEVVMRLLRGEGLDKVSRDTGHPAGVLSQWRDAFLDGGAQMRKRRADDPVAEAMKAE